MKKSDICACPWMLLCICIKFHDNGDNMGKDTSFSYGSLCRRITECVSIVRKREGGRETELEKVKCIYLKISMHIITFIHLYNIHM